MRFREDISDETRKPGYYWVREKPGDWWKHEPKEDNAEWKLLYFTGSSWVVCIDPDFIGDNSMFEIDERIIERQ